MPLYEFECTNEECECEIWEEIIKLAEYDESKVACTLCGLPAKRIYNSISKHRTWSEWRVGHGS